MGILGLVNSLMPLAVNVVGSVETLFGPKRGSQKKEAAVNAVTSVVNILGSTGVVSGVDTTLLMEGIGDIVEGIVKINNATGVFKKGA